MISLEQIKQLESRVHSAVARIRSLTTENATLKESLSHYESRIDELEKHVSGFKAEQQEIEAGIIAALSQLDGLEDAVAQESVNPQPFGRGGQPKHDTAVAPGRANDQDVSESADVSEHPESKPKATPTPAQSSTDRADSEDAADPAPTVAGSAPISVDLVDPDDEEPELDIF